MSKVWLIGLAALAFAGYHGKQKLDQLLEGLSYEPDGVNFTKNSLGLISTRFTFKMRIFNKSNVAVPIKSVSGVALTNNSQLANFNVQKAITIPANSSIVMPIDITASNLSAIALLKSIFTGKAIPKMQLKGGIYTLIGTAPLDITFDKINLIAQK